MGKQLIDIGINLMHKQFDLDRENLIEAALQDKITPLIITGTNIKESKKAASYAKKYPNRLFSTAGIHPHDAKTCNSLTIKELKDLTKQPCVCAIGECGLDYDRNFSPRDVQKKWFEAQIELAEELDMPLFLHERAAFLDFKKILLKHRNICTKAVVHCFTGDATELQTYLDMGCYIGITGWICDERRGKHLRSLIKRIPDDRLMIETDAPFLIPRNRKINLENKRNEPSYLRHIVEDIAICLNKNSEEVADITTANAKKFFGLSMPS